LRESFHVIAHAIDNSDKFMANYHRHRDRFLCPGVPVVDVHVRAADGCFQYADQRIVVADLWNGNFLEPQTGLGFCLHDGLHHFLHNRKLGQSANQEKSFGSSTESHRYFRARWCDLRLPRRSVMRECGPATQWTWPRRLLTAFRPKKI